MAENGVTKTGVKTSNGSGEELLIRVGWPGTEIGILAGPDGPGFYVYKKDLPTLIAKLQEVAAQN